MKAYKKLQGIRHSAIGLFGISIVSGLILSVPFWRYWLGWLIFIAMLPFFYLLSLLETYNISRRSKVGYIWLAGWVMLLGVTFWIVQTEPGRWTGLMGWMSTGSLILTYILFSGFLSLGFVLLGVGWVFLKPKFNQKRIFLVLPAIWVLAEWSRSWLFSLISLGPNTTVGPHWNFGDLGFAASVSPLVFIARFVGLYGLGFLVVVINLCVYWLLQKRWKLPVIILIFICLLSTLGYIAYQKPMGKDIQVGALQLGKNENLEIGSIQYHEYLNTVVAANKLDVIVLSEYSDVFQKENLQKDSLALSNLSTGQNTPVITSVQSSEGNKNYNTVIVYKPNGEELYRHNKQFLVPIGEAMPYAYMYLFKIIGQGKVIDQTASTREVSKGDTPAIPFNINGINIGLQACSGAISPELYRDLVRQGARVLTNSASLSIFANAQSYHNQAQQMARFMAVANARPFVQSTDGSYSFVMDGNGTWIAKSGQNNLQFLQAQITLNERRTLYTILGEWVIICSIGIVIGQAFVLLKPKKRKR